MRYGILVAFATAVAVGCGGKTDVPAPARTPSGPPGQTPPSAPADELGEEYDLGEYRIRPPKGFELKSDDKMPRGLGRLVVWQPADDLHSFSVAFITVPQGEGPATPKLTRELGLPDGVTEYAETPGEPVTLADLAFERCTARLAYRRSDTMMAGVVYSQGAGRTGVLIRYVGPAAGDDGLRRVADAAARSFRKT